MNFDIINKDKFSADSAKGLAIIAVVSIHLVSLFSPAKFTTPPFNLFFLSLDQIMRFCVPIFIFLSGIGLTLALNNQPIQVKPFIKKRLIKTIPLYLLWSGYYLATANPSQPWWHFLSNRSLPSILLNGQADYHLYFVPIILKLYLVFIIIKKLPAKLTKPVLIFNLLVQTILYIYFSVKTPFIHDQLQYYQILSWTGYFILGVWLADQGKFLSKKTSIFLTLTGFLLSTLEAAGIIATSGNAIQAIRFTKLSNFIYALGFIGLSLTTTSKFLKNKHLAWLGQNSYLIYLAHPALIHLYKRHLPLEALLQSLFIYLLIILLSLTLVFKKSARKL